MGRFKEWLGLCWAGIVAVAAAIIGLFFVSYRSKRDAEVKAANEAKTKEDKARVEGLHGNEEHRRELLR